MEGVGGEVPLRHPSRAPQAMTTEHETPRVSVIVPTYNRADLLPRAIDSVLAQTYGSYEILIVDDCSSDGTQDVIAGFSDPRIRSFRHGRNEGKSAAINTGISHAEGSTSASSTTMTSGSPGSWKDR